MRIARLNASSCGVRNSFCFFPTRNQYACTTLKNQYLIRHGLQSFSLVIGLARLRSAIMGWDMLQMRANEEKRHHCQDASRQLLGWHFLANECRVGSIISIIMPINFAYTRRAMDCVFTGDWNAVNTFIFIISWHDIHTHICGSRYIHIVKLKGARHVRKTQVCFISWKIWQFNSQ